jgi:ankyrin repeat protein
LKSKDQGFTALHFTSFKGNPRLSKLLIGVGADKYALNHMGINVCHVAAQGDQPISLYFFKELGMDLRVKDYCGNTPLHWACYCCSEVSLIYLLSWV